jgi:hypothetical protein
MTRISTFRLVSAFAALAFVVVLAVLGGKAISAQDKYNCASAERARVL